MITSLLSTVIIKIACDRELCSFILVALINQNVFVFKLKEHRVYPVERFKFPVVITCSISCIFFVINELRSCT